MRGDLKKAKNQERGRTKREEGVGTNSKAPGGGGGGEIRRGDNRKKKGVNSTFDPRECGTAPSLNWGEKQGKKNST